MCKILIHQFKHVFWVLKRTVSLRPVYINQVRAVTFTLSVRPHCFLYVCFVCFVALHPKSTAMPAVMVMAGRSVYKTTLFPGQA